MSDLTAATLTMNVVIHPDDVASYTNLGFEVTQDHLDRAVELYQNTVEQNYFDDLFNALLIAEQDIQVDAV